MFQQFDHPYSKDHFLKIKMNLLHSVPALSAPTKFSKREGFTAFQFLEGGAGKEGVTFFGWECIFFIKKKLKSEIFKYKKSS